MLIRPSTFICLPIYPPTRLERRQLRPAPLAIPLRRIVHRAALGALEGLGGLGRLVLQDDRIVAADVRGERAATLLRADEGCGRLALFLDPILRTRLGLPSREGLATLRRSGWRRSR